LIPSCWRRISPDPVYFTNAIDTALHISDLSLPVLKSKQARVSENVVTLKSNSTIKMGERIYVVGGIWSNEELINDKDNAFCA
jgi:hypothetical protein